MCWRLLLDPPIEWQSGMCIDFGIWLVSNCPLRRWLVGFALQLRSCIMNHVLSAQSSWVSMATCCSFVAKHDCVGSVRSTKQAMNSLATFGFCVCVAATDGIRHCQNHRTPRLLQAIDWAASSRLCSCSTGVPVVSSCSACRLQPFVVGFSHCSPIDAVPASPYATNRM